MTDTARFPEDTPPRSWHLKQLKWSIQGLARSDSDQQMLFPDRRLEPGELALDFDHWASVIRNQYSEELTPLQLDALAAVEQKLATMSRDGAEFDVDVWTDAALKTSEHWAEVRRLATAALEAFGWADK
jgi:hypothetical protein